MQVKLQQYSAIVDVLSIKSQNKTIYLHTTKISSSHKHDLYKCN